MSEYIGQTRQASKTEIIRPNPGNLPLQKTGSPPIASSGNVTVVCRFRPFNQKEIAMGAKAIVSFNEDQKNLTLRVQVSLP